MRREKSEEVRETCDGGSIGESYMRNEWIEERGVVCPNGLRCILSKCAF